MSTREGRSPARQGPATSGMATAETVAASGAAASAALKLHQQATLPGIAGSSLTAASTGSTPDEDKPVTLRRVVELIRAEQLWFTSSVDRQVRWLEGVVSNRISQTLDSMRGLAYELEERVGQRLEASCSTSEHSLLQAKSALDDRHAELAAAGAMQQETMDRIDRFLRENFDSYKRMPDGFKGKDRDGGGDALEQNCRTQTPATSSSSTLPSTSAAEAVLTSDLSDARYELVTRMIEVEREERLREVDKLKKTVAVAVNALDTVEAELSQRIFTSRDQIQMLAASVEESLGSQTEALRTGLAALREEQQQLQKQRCREAQAIAAGSPVDGDAVAQRHDAAALDAIFSRERAVLAAKGDLPAQLRAEFASRLEAIDAELRGELSSRVEALTVVCSEELNNRVNALDADLRCDVAARIGGVEASLQTVMDAWELTKEIPPRMLDLEKEMQDFKAQHAVGAPPTPPPASPPPVTPAGLNHGGAGGAGDIALPAARVEALERSLSIIEAQYHAQASLPSRLERVESHSELLLCAVESIWRMLPGSGPSASGSLPTTQGGMAALSAAAANTINSHSSTAMGAAIGSATHAGRVPSASPTPAAKVGTPVPSMTSSPLQAVNIRPPRSSVPAVGSGDVVASPDDGPSGALMLQTVEEPQGGAQEAPASAGTSTAGGGNVCGLASPETGGQVPPVSVATTAVAAMVQPQHTPNTRQAPANRTPLRQPPTPTPAGPSGQRSAAVAAPPAGGAAGSSSGSGVCGMCGSVAPVGSGKVQTPPDKGFAATAQSMLRAPVAPSGGSGPSGNASGVCGNVMGNAVHNPTASPAEQLRPASTAELRQPVGSGGAAPSGNPVGPIIFAAGRSLRAFGSPTRGHVSPRLLHRELQPTSLPSTASMAAPPVSSTSRGIASCAHGQTGHNSAAMAAAASVAAQKPWSRRSLSPRSNSSAPPLAARVGYIPVVAAPVGASPLGPQI